MVERRDQPGKGVRFLKSGLVRWHTQFQGRWLADRSPQSAVYEGNGSCKPGSPGCTWSSHLLKGQGLCWRTRTQGLGNGEEGLTGRRGLRGTKVLGMLTPTLASPRRGTAPSVNRSKGDPQAPHSTH